MNVEFRSAAAGLNDFSTRIDRMPRNDATRPIAASTSGSAVNAVLTRIASTPSTASRANASSPIDSVGPHALVAMIEPT